MSTEFLEQMKGKFVVSVQIDPPTDLKPADFLEKINQLRRIGVGVLDINSRTIPSLDPIILAAYLQLAGFEAMPHITARPSSVTGLLDQVRTGYAVFGVRNYLVVTGDRYRNVDDVGVFETDSVGIIGKLSKHFREQNSIEDVAFAAAVNQNNPNLDLEGDKVKAKCEAGTDSFMSQPVFNQQQTSELVRFYRQYTDKNLIVGVFPLIFPGMIKTIRAGGIEGIVMPDDVYSDSLRHIGQLEEWGQTQTGYLIADLKNNPDIAGVYIVAPNRNPTLLTGLLERVLT